jgi:hypothetical protein
LPDSRTAVELTQNRWIPNLFSAPEQVPEFFHPWSLLQDMNLSELPDSITRWV